MISALTNFCLMVNKFSLPRGTSDILPSDIILWQDLEQKARSTLKIYGYREVRTPLFEEAGLFARSMGETSDVVLKQMLSVKRAHQDSEEVDDQEGFVLRPEGTAAIVRTYIENHIHRKENLSKFFYLGPMFRGERPQKGRLRQFHQVGVEAIGEKSSSPYLDAEVISLSVRLLKDMGLKDFTLKINTLGDPKDKENLSQKLRKDLAPLIRDLSNESQQRFERNVFRILDSKNKKDQDIVDQLQLDHSHLSRQSQEYYTEVKNALDHLKVAYVEDFKLVRGLDYYTHTVFEISDSSLGSQDALGAGGRYNSLVEQLGGPQVDAVGFALGLERILLARPQPEEPLGFHLDVFLIVLDDKAYPKAFELLNRLRDHGLVSDMNYRISSVKSQMRLANKVGASYVMILGEDEFKDGMITLKDMEQGTQSQEKINDINPMIAKIKRS